MRRRREQQRLNWGLPSSRSRLKAATKRAGVRDVRRHDLRRTHGCRLLQDHCWSLEMAQARLGHSSIVTTPTPYAFLELEQRLDRAGFCAPDLRSPFRSVEREKPPIIRH
jgi:integrase